MRGSVSGERALLAECRQIERWSVVPLPELMAEASRLRDLGHGNVISYSRKVFIPLTRLCRDACRYCTFARGPRALDAAYLSPDRCLISRAPAKRLAARRRCSRWATSPSCVPGGAARPRPRSATHTTIDYLAAMCALVLRETGLLPHANPGVMSDEEIAALRRVSVSQGLMLENISAPALPARRAASWLAGQAPGDSRLPPSDRPAGLRFRSPPAS